MKTFKGDKKLKTRLIKETKLHQKLDAFIRGTWVNGAVTEEINSGCFYGCMVQSEERTLEKASEEYGLPLWYVHVTEKIYEGLPDGEWKTFPYEAIKVLPVGLDMNVIQSKFNQAVLIDQLRFCEGDKECTDAIKQCIDLFDVPFNEISESAAWSAAESAESAAESARSARSAAAAAESARSARSAARSAAWSARSAAWSAAWSARSAAWSAAESARSAESAAWSEHYVFLRDTLFNIIKTNK